MALFVIIPRRAFTPSVPPLVSMSNKTTHIAVFSNSFFARCDTSLSVPTSRTNTKLISSRQPQLPRCPPPCERPRVHAAKRQARGTSSFPSCFHTSVSFSAPPCSDQQLIIHKLCLYQAGTLSLSIPNFSIPTSSRPTSFSTTRTRTSKDEEVMAMGYEEVR
jgi:hypothetical protein